MIFRSKFLYHRNSFAIEISKTYFTCHYCPEAIIKKYVQLTCIIIGLEVLDDGQIFFGIARFQERHSIVCKHRRIEKAKTKVYIFFYKIFTNNIFKSYTAITMGFHALANWSHYKVKILQNSLISVLVILPSDIVPTSQSRTVLRPRAILLSTDSKKQLVLYYYKTYFQLEKA